jgi:hypothetical protein
LRHLQTLVSAEAGDATFVVKHIGLLDGELHHLGVGGAVIPERATYLGFLSCPPSRSIGLLGD